MRNRLSAARKLEAKEAAEAAEAAKQPAQGEGADEAKHAAARQSSSAGQ
ncbi:MAG TPA: hypothetical protein VFV10_04955 [Gammaproteobacteria bacterium]|nr:hypothetical protein [Gammaproteobacteria bacterium]